MSTQRWAGAALLFGVLSCSDAISPTPPPTPIRQVASQEDCEPDETLRDLGNVSRATPVGGDVAMECEDDGGGTPPSGGGGWPYFAPRGNNIYEAPNDPHPGQPGIWLGPNVLPTTCFADKAPSITDGDQDWLDDNCELELARGFAPHWGMAIQDPCVGGEPHWAAKYFPSSGSVRIAYMPSYYTDCGRPQFGFGGGHSGDSEFVMVQVGFNASTRHWEFQLMFLSAHDGTEGHRSSWNTPDMTRFTKRNLAHPYVEVSGRKHANYVHRDKCLQAAFDFESCENDSDPMWAFRFPIVANRNVGSIHNNLGRGCVAATNPSFSGNGRLECFYTQQDFRGWQAPSSWYGPSPAAYRSFLASLRFEEKVPDALATHCDWMRRAYGYASGECTPDRGAGPGPYYPPPSNTIYPVTIYGPGSVGAGVSCYWYASSGMQNAQYEWTVNGSVVGTSQEIWYSSSSDYTLSVRLFNGNGDSGSASKYVTINSSTTCEVE